MITEAQRSREAGDKTTAINSWKQLLGIFEATLGPNHNAVARCLENLGSIYTELGQHYDAMKARKRAFRILEEEADQDPLELATSLGNLAGNYYALTRYGEALKLYQRSLAIREEALPPGHPDIAGTLSNIANIYQLQGQADAAIELAKRALAAQENNRETHFIGLSKTLSIIALAHKSKGDYTKALPYAERAFRILDSRIGLSNTMAARAMSNLASLYNGLGLYDAAEAIYRHALAALEKSLGRGHPDTAMILNNLAGSIFIQGRASEAIPLLLTALDLEEQHLGIGNSDLAMRHNNISLLYQTVGKTRLALEHLRIGYAAQHKFMTRELPLLPVQQRSSQARALGNSWLDVFSLAANNQEAIEQALHARLNRHGLLAEIEQRQRTLERLSPEDMQIKEKIKSLTSELAVRGIENKKRLTIENQIANLEQYLYRSLPRLVMREVTVDMVRRSLPEDGALIELQRFTPYVFDRLKAEPPRLGNARYLGLILRANGESAAVDLGPAELIEEEIYSALSATEQGQTDAVDLWRSVSSRVIAPLMPHLREDRQWFISPDGEMNRIPFAALPFPGLREKSLASTIKLRLITTGRELLQLQHSLPRQHKPIVFANPNYGTISRKEPPVSGVQGKHARSSATKARLWQGLPATQAEGERIATLLHGNLFTGGQASTENLSTAQSPIVLHVATHGFFDYKLPDEPTRRVDSKRQDARQDGTLPADDSQLRSGIVLAGANEPGLDSANDGYLTAAEAVMLNLKGTELVVLSACSTGQGEIRTGEGIYGLQRALAVAGARSTLLSLWKVDDQATAAFMERFYTRLKAGDGRSDALAATQQEFQNGTVGKGQWRDPYYWAAWQLVGDWRPIRSL